MGEAGVVKMEPSHLECLALRLVDGHGKTQAHWELQPLEAEPDVTWRGYQRYFWDEYLLTFCTATEKGRQVSQ